MQEISKAIKGFDCPNPGTINSIKNITPGFLIMNRFTRLLPLKILVPDQPLHFRSWERGGGI